ncbi:MAG: WecB/TagA/CpsF family glycosyltransferase [Spirochaetaceae bacterium]|nr:WecB/TagA/CpsF family glycosyltransferase [Spirochaetaceae bacterium]
MADGVKRIHILGIPVDVVSDDALPGVIENFYSLKDHRQIIFLDFHEMMRVRHNKTRRKAITQAALIIPVSSLIVRAARFLHRDVPPLRRTYPFIIRLLGILENKNKSLYLLGSGMRGVRQAESTLKATFPGLQIVGRYASHFPGEREKDVITAIKKASPTLLLAGRGLKKQHLWLSNNRTLLGPGLSVWEQSCFDVFSGKRPKPDDRPTARFFQGFARTLVHPWRFFRFFRYLTFYLLLLVERIRLPKTRS